MKFSLSNDASSSKVKSFRVSISRSDRGFRPVCEMNLENVIVGTEGFLDIFKKKKPTKDDGSRDDAYFSIDPYDMEEILDAFKSLTDEQLDELLSAKIANIHKPTELTTFFKTCVTKYIGVVNGKLIPMWKAVEKFEWHNESQNPVDKNGDIKVPALTKAIDEVGKVANDILSSSEYTKISSYANDKDGLVSGSLKDLGFNKNVVKDWLTMIDFMMNDDRQDKWNYFYMTAEDHTDGWNYVVNHVVRDFWQNPKKFPALDAGQKVFVTTSAMIETLQRELSRFLVKFMAVTGTSAI